ncbi:MAG: hypothetical protein JWL70_3046 [Acidimicrobiia bacterium]|nr:hypothetical protein [Acidimicrobiia bacterium]
MSDIGGRQRLQGLAHIGVVTNALGGLVPIISTGIGVTLCDQPNFGGQTQFLGIGRHALTDFNDRTSSVRVPQGYVAYLYEHADGGGGYGLSVDLLEDVADLSTLNMAGKISFVDVFAAERDGLVWARGSMDNGQYVAGHWERKRAQPQPENHVAVVSPPISAHDLPQPVVTGGGTAAVPASGTIKNVEITKFESFSFAAQSLWDTAVTRQCGVIGSDYRGIEPIGSAAFERASNNTFIPDSLNFWYPQAQPNDHRGDGAGHFKRTLSGRLRDAHVADISGTFQDHDLNIDIEPADGYTWLLTDAHPREYTDIMGYQWNLSAHQSGQPNCDDDASKAEFQFVEAEVDSSPSAKARINGALANAKGRQICVYGPWIYDKGHCCHAEIHPCEQIWWSDPGAVGRVYFCHLLVDESERFWWRDQMDDGVKLKPWGAPPLVGTFAIAFETKINQPAKQFEITVEEAYNDVTEHEGFLRHHLVYGGNTLVSVVQDETSMLKISYEHVGLVEPDVVRGFIVLEATVGKCTQIATSVPAAIGSGLMVPIPPNSDVNQIPQQFERAAFRKEAGRLLMWVAEGIYRDT